jgi:hypothetical protein
MCCGCRSYLASARPSPRRAGVSRASSGIDRRDAHPVPRSPRTYLLPSPPSSVGQSLAAFLRDVDRLRCPRTKRGQRSVFLGSGLFLGRAAPTRWSHGDSPWKRPSRRRARRRPSSCSADRRGTRSAPALCRFVSSAAAAYARYEDRTADVVATSLPAGTIRHVSQPFRTWTSRKGSGRSATSSSGPERAPLPPDGRRLSRRRREADTEWSCSLDC